MEPIDFDAWARDLTPPVVASACGCLPPGVESVTMGGVTQTCACGGHLEVQAAPATATDQTPTPAPALAPISVEPDTHPDDIARITTLEATVIDLQTQMATQQALVSELFGILSDSVLASATFAAASI